MDRSLVSYFLSIIYATSHEIHNEGNKCFTTPVPLDKRFQKRCVCFACNCNMHVCVWWLYKDLGRKHGDREEHGVQQRSQ